MSSALSLLDDIIGRISSLPQDQQVELLQAVDQATSHMRWVPNPGPQTDAYFCEADELFYGGSAGGGKSELGLGLALTAHTKSLILRREREQVHDLFERLGEILDTDKGRNGQQLRWDVPGSDQIIRFAGVKEEKDKQKFKGRPYDLYVFDEIADFLKSQVMFIKTWNRSTKPGQRCRILYTGNPPTTAEGLWIIEYFAPWLDPRHPNPAKSGELRWFMYDAEDREVEVDGAGPHAVKLEDGKIEQRYATSRTFIRANLSDNPFLMKTDYGKSLDALPPEIRAAYRDGRFDLGLKDNPSQVIPTSWIIAAQKRWTKNPPQNVPMCAIGVAPVQGGADELTLAARHDGWYAPIVAIPGEKVPDGKTILQHLIVLRKDAALPIIDMGGGYGGAISELLTDNQMKWVGHKGALGSTSRTKDKQLGFVNKRSEAYWRFREALDPDQPGGSPIMLPDDPKLVADLSAATFTVKRGGDGVLEIKVEPKDGIKSRLGRSPDRGDAVIISWTDGAKADYYATIWNNKTRPGRVVLGHSARRRSQR